MTQNWSGVLIRHLLLVVAGGALLGLVTGQYGWAIAVALGAWLAHERFTAHDLGAMAVILVGVVVITLAKVRRK